MQRCPHLATVSTDTEVDGKCPVWVFTRPAPAALPPPSYSEVPLLLAKRLRCRVVSSPSRGVSQRGCGWEGEAPAWRGAGDRALLFPGLSQEASAPPGGRSVVSGAPRLPGSLP